MKQSILQCFKGYALGKFLFAIEDNIPLILKKPQAMFKLNTCFVMTFFVVMAGLAKQASAELLTIISLPVETSNPLPHTNFHASNTGSGTGGSILGWANLSSAAPSTYDPVTGDLDLHLNLYTTSANALANDPIQSIGEAHGVSSNLVGSDFNQFDGNVIGTIDWTFDTNVALVFFQHPLMTNVTMTFVDFDYVTTADGFTANTWDGKNLTLWGADGTYLGAGFEGGGKFDVESTTIGFDFVGVTDGTVIPEPSSMMLLLMGTTCLGGVGYWKRRRQGIPKQS